MWVRLFPFLSLFLTFGCTPQNQSSSDSSATSNPARPEGLIAYGDPVPLQLIGPYHVLCNQGYVSGYDDGIEDPRWVETRFFAVDQLISQKRPAEFLADRRIEPQYQVNTRYWMNSGYDRGHMAPNWGVDICYGQQAQNETFLLTNVIPQTPALNRGLWESLEKLISNDYAERYGQVWVICGPVFGPRPDTLKGKILIPDRCYKIVLRVDPDGSLHTLAFEMPQDLPWEHNRTDLVNYLTSIKHIEDDTHITFFPDLPTSTRNQLENDTNQALW